MSEKDDVNRAVAQLLNGNRRQAGVELLNLYNRVNQKYLKVQIIDGLLTALDPVKEIKKLLEFSEAGIRISKKLHDTSGQAYFMSRKADLIVSAKLPFLEYQLHNLKLASGWIGFSTEIDKKSYEALMSEVNSFESEADLLLKDALALVGTDKKVEGRILMSRGSIESSRYLRYKSEFMGGNAKAKWWLKFQFFRYPLAEYLFIFNNSQSKKLRSCIDSFTVDYLKAAKIYEQLNDSASGYAYHNLANHLKLAYKFWAAKKYLAKAKKVAQKFNDQLLIQQVKAMELAIKAKNKDTPDYLAGETRQGIGL